MLRKQGIWTLIFSKEVGADDKDSGATVREWEPEPHGAHRPDETTPGGKWVQEEILRNPG